MIIPQIKEVDPTYKYIETNSKEINSIFGPFGLFGAMELFPQPGPGGQSRKQILNHAGR